MAAEEPLNVVGQVVDAPIALIRVGDRLRPIDPVWSAALGSIMAKDGQNTPIEICRLPGKKGFLLVAGGHRLEGARLQGWVTIKAIIIDANALDRRMREVSENLWRKGLDPIDRAVFVAEFHGLLRARAGVSADTSGRAVSASVRWQKALKAEAGDASDIMSLAYGFTAEIGAQLGLSKRSIERDLALHRRLLPDVVERLRGHSLAGNAAQLAALTKLSEADQRQAVALITDGTAKGVSDAMGIITQKVAPTPDSKAWSAFFGGWNRMSTSRRREALRELAEQGLPKGVSIDFGDQDQ